MDPAFGDALVRLLPNLKRFGLSLSRRGDIADDLVQITVEKAILNHAGFDGSSRLEPWLFRIMRNAWIDMIRRTRTQGQQVDVFEIPESLPTDSSAQIEARLMLQSVQEAMTTLPDEQREILHLVCIEDMSYAEAAEILDIPKGTVMSRLSRARLALSEKLGIK